MLPDTKDLAALPTSWALTIWDAFPIYFGFEIAFAIAIVALLTTPWSERLWRINSVNSVSAVLYLLPFSAPLAATMAGMSLVVNARFKWLLPSAADVPAHPFDALRERGGQILWDVVKAAAVAAVIKVLLTPAIPEGSIWWSLLALVGGLVPIGSFGVSAVPALAAATAADQLGVGVLWLAVAALRPTMSRAAQRVIRSNLSRPGR